MTHNVTRDLTAFSLANETYDFDNLSLYDSFDFRSILEEFKRKEYFTLHQPETIAFIAMYSAIFLLAIVGNISVLLVIIPNRRMWSVTNNFLLNMAVADLLVTLVCIPMTVAERVYRLWIYGDVMCKLAPYLQVVSVSASTFTITLMSLDRCLAIRHPMKFRNVRTTKHVRLVILFIWLFSFLLAIPILFVRYVEVREIFSGAELNFCTETTSNRKVYDVCLLVLIFFVPGIVIMTSYSLMGRRLWIPDRKLSDDIRRPRGSRSDSECEKSLRNITLNRRRLAKLCIAIAIVFIMTWTPYFIVNTYVDFNPSKTMANVVSYTLLFGHLHCITNPILYCFLHKTFRHYILRCISREKPRPNLGIYRQDRYRTVYKSVPYAAQQFSSLRSATISNRRRSSTTTSSRLEDMNHRRRSSSSTSGRVEDPIHRRNSCQSQILVDVYDIKTKCAYSSLENMHIGKLSIPSCINEESRVISS